MDEDEGLIDLDAEEPPGSGGWADVHEDVLDLMSSEDYEAGNRLGELIDISDDDDNGLQYTGGPPR